MKGLASHFDFFAITFVLIVSFWPGTIMAGSSDTNYVIGPGDVLDISVWKDEDLTKQVTVLPDGMIHFPLIGEVTAGGKTVVQLREELNDKLASYVPDVSLSVIIKQTGSMLIYVIGRVNRPDRYFLTGHVDVLQALAMAGGPNPFAKKSKIMIIRKLEDDIRIFPFDYDDVTNGKNLEQNIILRRGDVIVVP
jgi:polysaccharide export outer membrane protein